MVHVDLGKSANFGDFPVEDDEEETITMMPEKAAESPLESLLANLRELFAREYQRGRDDTLAKVIAAAQGTAAPKRNGAPTTRDLIDTELGRMGSATARDIFEAGAGGVSLDGVIQCLKRGGKAGRYSNADGRWSLAAQPK